jgi:hypothetical protein
MIKKISAVMLAFVLCISAIVVSASAEVTLGNSQMAFALKWDKESYKAGDKAVLSVYMDADDSLSLYTGSFVIALNSAQISQADNDIEDLKANSTTDDTFASFFKGADTQLTWLATTIAPKVTAANTAEEQALYDHYLKYTGAKKSAADGWHENSASTKAGFSGAELDPATPIMTITFTVAADVADGTTLVAAITSGSKTCSPVQTTWKYYKNPGAATTTGNVAAADIDVAQAIATATIGEPAVHECTPAEAVQENVIPATCGADGSHDEVVYCSVCGVELSRTNVADDALGHDVVVDEAVAPNCITVGLTEGSHCSRCGEVFVAQEELGLGDHSYGEWEIVIQPEGPNDGLQKKTCEHCGHEVEEIVLHDEDWDVATIEDCQASVTTSSMAMFGLLTAVVAIVRKKRS